MRQPGTACKEGVRGNGQSGEPQKRCWLVKVGKQMESAASKRQMDRRQPRPLKTRVKTEGSVCVAFINTDLFSNQSLYKILRTFCTHLNDLLIVIL